MTTLLRQLLCPHKRGDQCKAELSKRTDKLRDASVQRLRGCEQDSSLPISVYRITDQRRKHLQKLSGRVLTGNQVQCSRCIALTLVSALLELLVVGGLLHNVQDGVGQLQEQRWN